MVSDSRALHDRNTLYSIHAASFVVGLVNQTLFHAVLLTCLSKYLILIILWKKEKHRLMIIGDCMMGHEI